MTQQFEGHGPKVAVAAATTAALVVATLAGLAWLARPVPDQQQSDTDEHQRETINEEPASMVFGPGWSHLPSLPVLHVLNHLAPTLTRTAVADGVRAASPVHSATASKRIPSPILTLDNLSAIYAERLALWQLAVAIPGWRTDIARVLWATQAIDRPELLAQWVDDGDNEMGLRMSAVDFFGPTPFIRADRRIRVPVEMVRRIEFSHGLDLPARRNLAQVLPMLVVVVGAGAVRGPVVDVPSTPASTKPPAPKPPALKSVSLLAHLDCPTLRYVSISAGEAEAATVTATSRRATVALLVPTTAASTTTAQLPSLNVFSIAQSSSYGVHVAAMYVLMALPHLHTLSVCAHAELQGEWDLIKLARRKPATTGVRSLTLPARAFAAAFSSHGVGKVTMAPKLKRLAVVGRPHETAGGFDPAAFPVLNTIVISTIAGTRTLHSAAQLPALTVLDVAAVGMDAAAAFADDDARWRRGSGSPKMTASTTVADIPFAKLTALRVGCRREAHVVWNPVQVFAPLALPALVDLELVDAAEVSPPPWLSLRSLALTTVHGPETWPLTRVATATETRPPLLLHFANGWAHLRHIEMLRLGRDIVGDPETSVLAMPGLTTLEVDDGRILGMSMVAGAATAIPALAHLCVRSGTVYHHQFKPFLDAGLALRSIQAHSMAVKLFLELARTTCPALERFEMEGLEMDDVELRVPLLPTETSRLAWKALAGIDRIRGSAIKSLVIECPEGLPNDMADFTRFAGQAIAKIAQTPADRVLSWATVQTLHGADPRMVEFMGQVALMVARSRSPKVTK